MERESSGRTAAKALADLTSLSPTRWSNMITYTTLEYDVSPATVQFMSQYYPELNGTPPSPARQEDKVLSPTLNSPGTKAWVILKHLLLFGPLPVPELAPPLSAAYHTNAGNASSVNRS